MAFFQRSGGHPTQAPGFGAAPDPFASISQDVDDDEEAIDFEDTYDGLGDQLEEEGDDLNDDTFGGGESTAKAASKDFDFFGSTSKVSDAINEEAVRFNRQQPPSKSSFVPSTSKAATKPFKSGYESYKDPVQVGNLQADPGLWGTGPPAPATSQQTQAQTFLRDPPQQTSFGSKKMMSLDEIEAMMFSQPKRSTESQPSDQSTQRQAQPLHHPYQIPQPFMDQIPVALQAQGPPAESAQMYSVAQQLQNSSVGPPVTSRSHQAAPNAQANRQTSRAPRKAQAEVNTQPISGPQAPRILQRPQEARHSHSNSAGLPQPRQILHNVNRQTPQPGAGPAEQETLVLPQSRVIGTNQGGAPVSLPIITHPSQLKDLTDEQRQAFMIEDAKRAKRNHKIFLLSKDNGLMTPQDKNFITRIQLQQLMTATGNVNETDPDIALSEDFYYQVYNQIENRPRLNPHQPLSNFAQTYLFQTGNRQGTMGRRMNRGGDTHVHRMQQQVQRAVEAAKLKPKGKQLVIEGSLGKISFSNAKTPKPLLNIKRNEGKVSQATLSSTDRKAILKNIEAVYSTLMRMEDHDRRQPPPPANDDELASQHLSEWRQAFQDLNQRLWGELKVMEPIIPESTVLHPFIAFLSYPKGKKAIPRVFSQIDPEQRLTILTIIMVQLDTLDVVRSGLPQVDTHQSPSVAREQVDLFLQTVMPTLFSYVTKAPLSIVMGLLGLLLDRVNVQAIIHTRVGLEILTMLLSQAEIIRKGEATNEQEWEQWLDAFKNLFDTVEPVLADIFPGSVSAGQDVYVWQFLATVGTGASPDQQQRLVLAVKDRVMETVKQSKTLPADMATQRRADVNLFMQAIGLDVDLLDG